MDAAVRTRPHPQDSELIDRLGGTGATAALCDVSSQAVTHWRTHGIPKARRMYLQLLRPDAFSGPEKAQSEPAT